MTSLTVKEHNILKSLSIVLIAIGSISAATLQSLPYASYLGVFVALCGALGYPIANALVDPSTALSGVESVITAIMNAADSLKAVPAQPKPSVSMINPATVAALEAAVNQVKADIATQAQTSPSTQPTAQPPQNAPPT